MKTLNFKRMHEIEYDAITNYISENPATNFVDNHAELEDFAEDAQGNIYFLYSWKDDSYSDSETGHNVVHEMSSEKYHEYLTAEKRKEIIKKEYTENKEYYNK
jgi:hypothetical protein